MDDVYIDTWGMKAVKADSNLYDQLEAGRTFKQIELEAVRLGLSQVGAAMRTDEELLYFIGVKTGIIKEQP